MTGSGTPPAGLASLTADVSAITTSQSAAALSSGSYTVDGQSYNYRSAQLTAKSTLSAGTDSFTVKLTDSAGTATTHQLLGHRRQHRAATRATSRPPTWPAGRPASPRPATR